MTDSAKDMKVGLFEVGLNTYWGQFEGLLDRLVGYRKDISGKIGRMGVHVVDPGMVDSPEKALQAADLFKKEGVEIIFLFVSTYALSSTVLPAVRNLSIPVIILNVQPVPAIDYDRLNGMGDRGVMTGEWLAHCQACSLPEIAHTFNRAGIKYEIVTGYLQEEYVWKQIEDWIAAAKAVAGMRANKTGILGHYYCGMLDVYSDTTLHAVALGTHFELLEMCRLRRLRDAASSDEVEAKIAEFQDRFDVVPQCDSQELIRAAKTSVALDHLVREYGLGSLAYYYEGTPGSAYEDIITSIIPGSTLLTAYGIPIAGECEVKNVQAMKIMSLLGMGGSFAEFYALDFNDNVVLLGHDGPAHFAMSESKVKLVPLPVYHGKPGKGLSIQMSVKQGPVTVMSLCEIDGKLTLLLAEGEAEVGKTLQIGNTNSRYRFPLEVRDFINRWSEVGPSHHCTIGVGHRGDLLRKFAFLAGLNSVTIC